jgi:hypothetical protein
MDEARKFFRYIIPVAVYALETGLFLWIILPSWTIQQLDRLQDSEWWSVAIIGIAGSGGLGFLFNTIHHWLNLHFPTLHASMAYRELIMNLKSNGVLVLRDSRTRLEAPLEWPNKEVQAWSILSGLWHERAGKDSKIHMSNQRAESLANLVHSTGAASVAAASALVTALIVVGCAGEWGPTSESVARYLLAVFVGLSLVCLHEWSYRDTVNLTKCFLEQVLADALLDETQPVQTYVPIPPSKPPRRGGG